MKTAARPKHHRTGAADAADPKHHRISTTAAHIDASARGLERQERLLLGASTGSANVEAYREAGALRKIVVVRLTEADYTIDAFYFDADKLIRLRHRRYGRPNHPRVTQTHGVAYAHPEVGAGGERLASDLLDFDGGRLLDWAERNKPQDVRSPEAEAWRTKALIEAHNYVTLMNTPLPDGASEDDAWSCVQSDQEACAVYQPR